MQVLQVRLAQALPLKKLFQAPGRTRLVCIILPCVTVCIACHALHLSLLLEAAKVFVALPIIALLAIQPLLTFLRVVDACLARLDAGLRPSTSWRICLQRFTPQALHSVLGPSGPCAGPLYMLRCLSDTTG